MCKSVQTKGKTCAKVENAEFAHPFTTFAQISPLVCTLLHMNKFDANPWGKLSSTITDSSTLVSFKNYILGIPIDRVPTSKSCIFCSHLTVS